MSDPNLTPPPFSGPQGSTSGDTPAGPPAAGPPQPGQFTPSSPSTGQSTPPPAGYGQPNAYGQPGFTQPGVPQPYQQPYAQPYQPQSYGEGFLPELGVMLGSKGKRIGAKAIDIAIVVAVQAVVGFVAGFAFYATSNATTSSEFGTSFTTSTGFSWGAIALIALVSVGFDFLYNVVCTAKFGGTPGKLMLGLRVISQQGPPADMGIAFRRWTPSFALLLLGNVPLIGLFAGLARFFLLIANLVMVLVDQRRRDVFDHVGGTYVVEKS